MLKKILFWTVICFFSGLHAQQINTPYKTKKIVATRDTIRIDSVSVNSAFFKLLDAKSQPIDTAFYKVDYEKELWFSAKITNLRLIR